MGSLLPPITGLSACDQVFPGSLAEWPLCNFPLPSGLPSRSAWTTLLPLPQESPRALKTKTHHPSGSKPPPLLNIISISHPIQALGVGRAKMLQETGKDGPGRQDRVGILEAKERDNFTRELASNATCHQDRDKKPFEQRIDQSRHLEYNTFQKNDINTTVQIL